MKNLPNIYVYIFSALFAIIPFTEHLQAVPNILMGILICIFPFVVKKSDWQLLTTKTIYFFLALILIVLVGILLNKRWEDFSFLSKIILAPVLLVLTIPVKDYKKPLYFFLAGSLTILFLSAINLTKYYLIHHNLKMDVGQEVNQLLMGERPYLGFIYLISFCLCVCLSKIEKKSVVKKLIYTCAVLLCVFILLISARLSILSMALILGSSFFFAKNKKRTFFISFGGISLLVLLAVFNPNFMNRFTAGFEQEKFEFDKIVSFEPRSHIWGCSVQIGGIKEVPILGYGFRNTINKLTECYSTRDKFLNEAHKAFFVESRFNTHNQFLNFYLSSGLISLIFFFLFFFFLFRTNFSNYTLFALTLGLFLFCSVENVLSRQLGAMLFGVVVSFLFLIRNYLIYSRK